MNGQQEPGNPVLLLDTCSLLWLTTNPKHLSASAIAAIQKAPESLFVSSISAFEIGIKYQKGKLTLPLPASEWFAKAVELHGLTELPITAKIAALSTELPPHHDDPIDRLLIATAIVHKLPLLTPDTHIKQYQALEVIW